MSKAPLVARILLGLIFFVFGLNGFLHFIPMPPMPEEAGALMGALAATGYFFPVLKITEIVSGALLLSGLFVPLALILLAPIVVQIFLFHAVLAPGSMALPIVIVILQAYLGFVAHRGSFDSILSARTE
jgi:uncharacterized membrane protein YphA (DoxX/SURF4 family)